MTRRHVNSSQGRRRARTPVGFSVIELLGALLLSAIVATMALAATGIFERQMPLSSAAQRLAGAMATARAMAISQADANVGYAVVIDRLTSGTQTTAALPQFWIDKIDATTGATKTPKVVAPETFGEKTWLDAIYVNGAKNNSGAIRLRFLDTGVGDDACVYLKLKADVNDASVGKVTTVRLYGATGQSRVFEHRKLVP
jgi:Tfp pilus assembly protein FimT